MDMNRKLVMWRQPANQSELPAEIEKPVSIDVAIEDARCVLRWLIQMHECEHTRLTLPRNIEQLARRAVSVFGG